MGDGLTATPLRDQKLSEVEAQRPILRRRANSGGERVDEGARHAHKPTAHEPRVGTRGARPYPPPCTKDARMRPTKAVVKKEM